MFYRLNSKGGKLPGKIVVLTHDIAHRYGHFFVNYVPIFDLSGLVVIQMLRQS